VLSSRRQRQRAILAAMAVLGILLGALAFNIQWLDSNEQAATYDTFITQAPAKTSNQVTIVALDDKTQVPARSGGSPALERPIGAAAVA
jgi:CHASE2 domain-containing sensor protein